MTLAATAELRRIDRVTVAKYLDQLSSWLLPGDFYGVHHTWPQLYRSDGDGNFLSAFVGDRMISHCAFRTATIRTDQGPRTIALLGSVATDPEWRRRGLASQLLSVAIDDCREQGVQAILLWAQAPGLYQKIGFVPGPEEPTYRMEIDPHQPPDPRVRLATIDDHPRLHELHEQKPVGIDRRMAAMTGLLTTPGMWTCVLEQRGQVQAYACMGKGADLQNWWHEFGGSDEHVAALLPPASRLVRRSASTVLWPHYRRALPQLLGAATPAASPSPGPMIRLLDGDLPAFWIDGLDSV